MQDEGILPARMRLTDSITAKPMTHAVQGFHANVISMGCMSGRIIRRCTSAPISNGMTSNARTQNIGNYEEPNVKLMFHKAIIVAHTLTSARGCLMSCMIDRPREMMPAKKNFGDNSTARPSANDETSLRPWKAKSQDDHNVNHAHAGHEHGQHQRLDSIRFAQA